MIIKFQKFNEEIVIGEPINIREGDRVIGKGTIKHFTPADMINVDVDGQTGVVTHVQRGAYMFFGVIFDNYFCPVLTNIEDRTKIKRCLWVGQSHLEKVDIERDIREIKLSPKIKRALEYIEYLGRPFFGKGEIDYVDVSSSPDTVTYMPVDRLSRLSHEDDQWDNKYRQEMRIGRFLQLINPYTEQKSLDRKIKIYKSAFNNLIVNKYNFKLVSGEDIVKWYDEASYHEGGGTLNKSCMRNKLDRLNIYTENPDKVNLLIMVNEDNKLMGRALIWHVDEPKMTYMDRPYTVFQEDRETFASYAYRHKWTFWTESRDILVVHLKRNYGAPEYNPYMDTFQYFCKDGDKGKYYLASLPGECEKYYIYDEA
jgi:hypothetical protein